MHDVHCNASGPVDLNVPIGHWGQDVVSETEPAGQDLKRKKEGVMQEERRINKGKKKFFKRKRRSPKSIATVKQVINKTKTT